MSKFLQILLIAAIAVALCQAEAPRSRFRSSRFNAARRSRVSARQEAAPEPAEAVTPYPSADELKPEVPFNEVEAAGADADAEAEAEPNKPDEVYGPPEIEADEEPEAEAEAAEGEEEVAAEEEPAIEEAAAEEEPEQESEFAPEEATEEPQAERLVFGRRVGSRRASRPAKLRAAPRPARLQQQRQRVVAQPLYVAAPFAYTAQLRQW